MSDTTGREIFNLSENSFPFSLFINLYIPQLTLIEGAKLDATQIELACAITARFSQGRDAESVEVLFSNPDQSSQQIHIRPLPEIQQEWYIT